MAINLKKGDLQPKLEATLKQADQVIDLSNSDVYLVVRDPEGDKKIDSKVTITDAKNGDVEYEWQAGDTDTAGLFEAEFVVERNSGDEITVPNVGFIPMKVDDDITR